MWEILYKYVLLIKSDGGCWLGIYHAKVWDNIITGNKKSFDLNQTCTIDVLKHLPQWGFQSNLLAHLLCIKHICDSLLPLLSHTESRIYDHMAIVQGDGTFVSIQHILDLKVHNGLFHLKREICNNPILKTFRWNDFRENSTGFFWAWDVVAEDMDLLNAYFGSYFPKKEQ